MGQISRRCALSLRKSLVCYVIAFSALAVFLSMGTFSICNHAVEGIRASYPPSGEKYYLTNEQGEQLGEGVYIGEVSAPLSAQDEPKRDAVRSLCTVCKPRRNLEWAKCFGCVR